MKISRRNSRPSPDRSFPRWAGKPAPPSLELARTRALLRARASWPAWPTAGQSVRRIQAPTGEDALWHQTVSEVFSSPGTLLGAQRHARADRITSHSRHTDGRHHTEGDQVLLTHTNADRARGVTRGQQRSLAARLQAALVLTDSSMPGLTWTPMISQQSPSPSLQQLANQCAGLGFKPPPGKRGTECIKNNFCERACFCTNCTRLYKH